MTDYDMTELKYYTDMLYRDFLHDEWGFKTCRIRDEKNKRINQAMFVLLIDKITKETIQLFFSLNDKNLLKKLHYLGNLEQVNSFITISSFRPQKNYYNEPDFHPFRRIHNLAYKCNVLVADLDFYHKEGRFKGKSPEEVWEVIKEEKRDLLEKIKLVAIKSGNGLQLYTICETFYFNGGRRDEIWKRFNEAFNYEFKEYGADPKCTADKSRVFRFPGSYNYKGEEAIKVQILTDTDIPPVIYSNNELRYALYNSLYELKKYHWDDTEKMLYFGENYEEDEEENELNIQNESSYNKSIDETDQEEENDIQLVSMSSLTFDNNIRNEGARKTKSIVLKEEKPIRLLTKNARLECQINGSKGHNTLISNRLNDLIIYAKRRNWDLYRNRNEFLFIYGSILWQDNMDTGTIYNILTSLNNRMKEPLDNNEVIAIVNSIASGKYRKIKNVTIADKLEFTKLDISQMKSSYSKEAFKQKNSDRQKRWYKNHRKDISRNDEKTVNNIMIVWNFLSEIQEKNLHLSEKEIDIELQKLTGLKERQVRKYKSEVRKMMKNKQSP